MRALRRMFMGRNQLKAITMKKLLFISLIAGSAALASCTKYGCSCDGQPVQGETYSQNEPGSNIAELNCELSSNCQWVKAN